MYILFNITEFTQLVIRADLRQYSNDSGLVKILALVVSFGLL